MNIPLIGTLKHPIADSAGNINDGWHRVFMQLFSQLQQHLSDGGYLFPAQTTDTINSLLNTSEHAAKIIYDSTTKSMKLNNENEFKEIYTRPPQLTTAERTAIPLSKINGSWVYDTDLNKLYYGINQTWREVAFT